MLCPNCRFENQEQSTECLRCGIVFAKYHARPQPVTAAAPAVENAELQEELRQELKCRVLGIPLALIAARIGVSLFPFLTGFLRMLLHECGHAVTAWFCGYSAAPGLWFTSMSESPEPWMTLVIVGILAGGSFWARKTNRPYLVAISVVLFIVHLVCRRLNYDRAQALIAFGGDGGALVLGSLLMMTLYVRPDSPVYENQLRWGFLVIGAAAFIDTVHTWTGSEDNIPFGVQEGTQTDPSQLVENYRWTIQAMIQSYVRLAELCFLAVAVIYIVGIVRARKRSLVVI
jgi:hypothetical protein